MVADLQAAKEEIENLRKEAQDNKGHMLEVLILTPWNVYSVKAN